MELDTESAAAADVDVNVRVQASSRSSALARETPAMLVRMDPHTALEVAEKACTLVLGLIGVVLLMTGHVTRVISETCSVAGRTAIILAKGEGDDDG